MKNTQIITKTFFKLLPIQIIIVAISSVNSIIDGVVATNLLGPTALSVCGLFHPIVKLMDTVNVTLLGGAQILCGKYIGKNQVDRSKSVFSIDMIAVVMFGALLSLICFFGSGQISTALVDENSLATAFCDYMKGYAPGIIPYLLVTQFTAFLQIENQEKRTYIGMAAMILTNIVADIVFVKVFSLGTFGLGLATSLSNFVYVIILVSFYFKKKAAINFTTENLKIRDLAAVIKIGFVDASLQFAQVLRGFLLNSVMLSYIGTIGVSAFSAVNTFGCLFYATTAGIANATRVLCSVYIGEEDKNALKAVMKTAVKKGILMVSCSAMVVFVALSGFFTNMFYTEDAGLIYSMTQMGFIFFPLSMPFSCFLCVYVNYYQCRNKLRIANALSVLDGVVFVATLSLILVPYFSMNGIWISQLLNGVLTSLVILVYTFFVKKKIPTSIEDTLVLPESFGVSDNDRIDVCVQHIDEVLNLSKLVMEFCEKHNVDKRRSMYAGLSIEEMAGNIIEYGFVDGKKHTIDIRVVYKGDSLLLRIKDDCKMFNPKAYIEVMQPEDVTKNIGMRIVSGIASNVDYINSYGLNVLTLEI